MIGFMISIFPFRSRVSFQEAFEGLELGEGKLSRPVLRGPGGRKAAWLLGNVESVADPGRSNGRFRHVPGLSGLSNRGSLEGFAFPDYSTFITEHCVSRFVLRVF